MVIQTRTEAELLAEGKIRGLARVKEKGLSGKIAENFSTSFAKAFVKSFMKASEETSEEIARNLIKAGTVALDLIAEACGLTLQRVQELAKTN